MFSSQKSLQKRTIMDYLPEHERAKVRKLVERLAQQTQQKQKFKKLYEQMTQKYEQLNKKYEELQEHCDDLKSQIATSRMAINKAKQAYIASKSAKKMKKIQDYNNFQFENQNKLDTQTLKQTWLKIPKSNVKTKNSEDKQDKKQYIFQQNQNNLSKSNFNTNSHQKLYPPLPFAQRFEETSLKKTAPRKNYRDTMIQSSNKKQQIVNLRKQIESLTQEMKKKQTTGLPFNEKIKKCEQIKNRYLKSKEKGKKRKNESQSQQNSSGIQSDDEGEKISKSKSRITHSKGTKSKKQIENDQDKSKSKKSSYKFSREQRYSQDDKSDRNQSQNQEQQEIQARTELKFKKSSNNLQRSNMNMQKHEKEIKKQQKDIKGTKNQISQTLKSNKNSKQETNKTQRSRKEPRKLNSQSKFDESLFAVINQLNSGN